MTNETRRKYDMKLFSYNWFLRRLLPLVLISCTQQRKNWHQRPFLYQTTAPYNLC